MQIRDCFDSDGNFTLKSFDPYRYEEDCKEYVEFYNCIFYDWNDKWSHGCVKEDVHKEIWKMVCENMEKYSPFSDIVKLYYAEEMGRNTKGSYPAVYMWR